MTKAPQVFTSSKEGYLILSGFCGLFAAGWITVWLKHPSTNSWQALLLIIFAWGFGIAWLKAIRFSFHESELSYQTLFSGMKSMKYSEIISASIEVGLPNDEVRGRGIYRLVIRSTNEEQSHEKQPIELSVNLKPFSKPDWGSIAAILLSKATQIKGDAMLEELSSRSF
jgi:hypothetical protein